MKTIVSRMKTLVNDNKGAGQTLSYVQHVEVLHPELALSVINRSVLPSIFIIPVSTVEDYEASQRKIHEHVVRAFLVMEYNQRELSIIGDASRPNAQGKGILDLVNDFMTVFRGHRLAVNGDNYLDKPLAFTDVEYIVDQGEQNAYLLIAQITMRCTRLFLETSLPGNI